MQVMRVSMEIPLTDENASPLVAMFGGHTKMIVGTEVMVEGEDDARQQGLVFQGYARCFLEGWIEGIKLDEGS